MASRQARRNAYLYCMFRDEQYGLYDRYAKSHGLLMKTFLVLNALYYAEGGMTQKEIAERIYSSKQTVSLVVRRLVEEGAAVAVEDAEDRRSTHVSLTEEGRARYGETVRHITQSEDEAMAMLSEEEQEQLVSLSRRFTENLAALVEKGM